MTNVPTDYCTFCTNVPTDVFNIPADQMFFLDHCPEGGFKHLLLCLKQFNIEKVFVTHSKESKTIKKTILDIILSRITAVLLFLNRYGE